jgi:ubiquinone/menaquinone biosynthesis C-methylase UbiE
MRACVVVVLFLAWIALVVDLVSAMSTNSASTGSAPPVTMASTTSTETTTSTPAVPAHSFDTSAQSYSDNVTRFTVLYAVDLIRASLKQMSQAKTILEVGCGAGAFGLAYLGCFPRGIEGQTVICTDVSPNMVSTAEQVVNAKLPPAYQTRFVFQVADGSNLEDFPDDSCDVLASVFGVFLIPDRAAALRECRRVLKKGGGGLLATTAWTTTGHNQELQDSGFGANLHDALGMMRVLPPGTPLEDRVPQPMPPLIQDWFDRDKIDEMLKDEENRFQDVCVHRSVHSIVFGSVDELWTAYTKSSPHGAAVADQDAAQVQYARKALGTWVAPDGNEDGPLFIQAAANLVLAT